MLVFLAQRQWPEFSAIREEINKINHPARPEVNWRLIESLALTLFRTNGVDLQTTAYYALARTQKHVLAALIWVGGMFFAWMILRPAAMTALDGPPRLKLWVEVFQRFFVWVWVAIVILPISGVGLLQIRFNGFETAPRYVQVMMGLYIVMVALFIRIQSLQLPELRKAVEAQDWAAGAGALGRIRRLVGCNLIVGLVLVAIAAARPMF